MATYVGEGLAIFCEATDPVTGLAITDATAIVEFFAPPKVPAKVTTDRTVDEGPFDMSYDDTVENKDGTTGAYVAFVDTTGWAGGKWSYRVTISGAYESWDYATITLTA